MNEIKRISAFACYGICVASLLACKGGSNTTPQGPIDPNEPPPVVGGVSLNYKNVEEG